MCINFLNNFIQHLSNFLDYAKIIQSQHLINFLDHTKITQSNISSIVLAQMIMKLLRFIFITCYLAQFSRYNVMYKYNVHLTSLFLNFQSILIKFMLFKQLLWVMYGLLILKLYHTIAKATMSSFRMLTSSLYFGDYFTKNINLQELFSHKCVIGTFFSKIVHIS